jgi:LmbE family N-acetylglucosaminyl deacetylase
VRGRHVAVVSPHLDDAVLSLGATIARWAASGARVTVLTVFAGPIDSAAPAAGWDRRGGFSTEGEAARGRREEDRRACAVLGAAARWLRFSDGQYATGRDEDTVRSAVQDELAGADLVVLPGFPLTHPDHAWLAGVLRGRRLGARRVALYLEQPYADRRRRERPPEDFPPQWRGSWWSARSDWRWLPAKWRAIREYRTQLPLLGLDRRRGGQLLRLLLDESRRGGERIVWLPPD